MGVMCLEFATSGIGPLSAAAGAEFAVYDMEHLGWRLETIKMLALTSRATNGEPDRAAAGHAVLRTSSGGSGGRPTPTRACPPSRSGGRDYRSRLRTLKAVFGWFVEMHLLEGNSFDNVEQPELDRHEVKYVKPEELIDSNRKNGFPVHRQKSDFAPRRLYLWVVQIMQN